MGDCLFIRRNIDVHKTPLNPPEQVDNVLVSPGLLSAILTWDNPTVDQNNSYAGVNIIRKENDIPLSETDGILVYSGNDNTYKDEGLIEGITYYYRFFAYNDSGVIQNAMRYVSLTAIRGYIWKRYKPVAVFGSMASQITLCKQDGSSADVTYYTGIDGLTLTGETTINVRYNNRTTNLAGNYCINDSLNYGIGKIAGNLSPSRVTGKQSSGSVGYITTVKCTVYSIVSISKGDYIDQVISTEQDAYTNDSVNDDGYWYELQAS